MKKATLFDLLGYPEQKELEYQGYGTENIEISKLDMKNLLTIGYVLLRSIYGMGPVPSVNIVCFAVDELTKRAEKQNLSIF